MPRRAVVGSGPPSTAVTMSAVSTMFSTSASGPACCPPAGEPTVSAETAPYRPVTSSEAVKFTACIPPWEKPVKTTSAPSGTPAARIASSTAARVCSEPAA